MVTVLEEDELAAGGGLTKTNLGFDSMICSSVSSDGPSWYLDCKISNINLILLSLP